MFAFDDPVPTTISLLLQCGYRSKVCTNHRATKLDGTLHKLCEFHRRKANLNQLKLHKQQREERARKALLAETPPTKKPRRNIQPITIEPIHHSTEELYGSQAQHDRDSFTKEDMQMLEMLLFDGPLKSADSCPPESPSSTDETASFCV